jgi:hypothetical protein
MKDLLTPQIKEEIQNRINAHHTLYDTIKIDSLYWEHILAKSLQTEYSNVEWVVGSHGVGTDIICEGIKISCKGGVISGKKVPKLTVSSHRTTQYETLGDKLNYLKRPHEDVIYSLAHYENSYRLTLFTPPNVENFVWNETKTKWRGTDNVGNVLDIVKKMSDQYWMKLVYNDLNKITYDFTRP